MIFPVTVIASSRPSEWMLHAVDRERTTLIVDRSSARLIGAENVMARGQLVTSEPDVYYRTPGCACCAVRQDLVDAMVRSAQRVETPERLLVLVDPNQVDLLTVISTILSSFEIIRRASLDSVVVHVDAVEMATRLTTGSAPVDDGLATALAVADRVGIVGLAGVTSSMGKRIRQELAVRSGFADVIDRADRVFGRNDLVEAWHGAPRARSLPSLGRDRPSTTVLRVDRSLDAEAIDEWLDNLVAAHASRLFRIQGALSVLGNSERTCCYGVRSFATSHSEREHLSRHSTESVLAICGVGLDADELAASFRDTVAS